MIGLSLLRWGCGGGGATTLFVLLCVSLVTVRSCGAQITSTVRGDAGDYDPGPATCQNTGLDDPDNPFRGWPMAGRSWDSVTYYYCAPAYYERFGRHHYGIDIDAYHREPVLATAHAIVVRASYDTVYGMGKNVKVCAANGWCAVYMHLDEWSVEVGQSVSPGTHLGYTDNTGFSTGTHLHYQINDPGGQPVDPAPAMRGGS